MTSGTVTSRRLLAVVSAAALTTALLPGPALGAATDPELVASAELPAGDIQYQMELGTLHFFDEEGQPFAIQAIAVGFALAVRHNLAEIVGR